MKLIKISDLFDVKTGVAYGNINLIPHQSEGTLPYIRPSNRIKRIVAGYLPSGNVDSKYVFKAGTIIVGTDGQGSHTYSYVCPFDFVPNTNVAVLIPKVELTHKQKLFYALCVTHNRFKFSYGRKPKGERLTELLIPAVADIPAWVESAEVDQQKHQFEESMKKILNSESKLLDNEDLVPLNELFECGSDSNLHLNKLEKVKEKDGQSVNYISATAQNNGISAVVKVVTGISPTPGNCLSISTPVGIQSFYQKDPFYSPEHMFFAKPKNKAMGKYEMLFYAMCINANKYRYNYGRKADTTYKHLLVPKNCPSWIKELDKK